MSDVQHNLDGTVTVTMRIPPAPGWNEKLDNAFARLEAFCSPISMWDDIGMFEARWSVDKLCVLERKSSVGGGHGGATLAGAVCGVGPGWIQAIDDAIALAKEWDERYPGGIRPGDVIPSVLTPATGTS